MELLVLCIAGFVAAFVDSIAGGGGLISLPAFLIVGIPPHIALGTNKFSAACASFTSSIKFIRSGKVNFEVLKYLIPFSLIGAVIGVRTILNIDTKYLYTMVLILILAVSIYSFFAKSVGMEDNYKGITRRNIVYGCILALGIGFYDGFFGPGTGSFLIFGMIGIYGFDFVKAGGNAKLMNFVSNITSLVMFAFSGKIDYKLGIPVALFMIVGARFGTVFAIKKGAKMIRPIFIIMACGVAVKMLFNIFK